MSITYFLKGDGKNGKYLKNVVWYYDAFVK